MQDCLSRSLCTPVMWWVQTPVRELASCDMELCRVSIQMPIWRHQYLPGMYTVTFDANFSRLEISRSSLPCLLKADHQLPGNITSGVRAEEVSLVAWGMWLTPHQVSDGYLTRALLWRGPCCCALHSGLPWPALPCKLQAQRLRPGGYSCRQTSITSSQLSYRAAPQRRAGVTCSATCSGCCSIS